MAKRFAWVGLLLLLLVGCRHWDTVAYQPRPLPTEHEALQRFEQLSRATSWGAPLKVEVNRDFAVLTYVNPQGVYSRTISFSEVRKVKLLKRGDAFGVEVFDVNERSIGWFEYENLNRAQDMVDVFAWLTGRRPEGTPPPTTM